jgi:DNA-binding response OmpR family regulator
VDRETLAKTGQALVERKVLAPDALARALEGPAETEAEFLEQLVDQGDATEGALVAFLAERAGAPGIDLSRSAFLLSVLQVIPRPVAEHDRILPLSTEGGRLHVAVIDPNAGKESIDEVRFITGMDVSVYVALPSALLRCITEAFDACERSESVWRGAAVAPDASPMLASLQPLPLGPERQAAAASSGQPIEELLIEDARSDDEILEGELLEAELVEEVEDGPMPEAGDELLTVDDPAVTRIDSAPSLPALVAAPPSSPGRKKPASIEIQIAPPGDGDEEEEEIVGSVHTGPRRIMVVDDEPDIIRLCTRALQIKGYLVESAADGALAEARLKKQPAPDLVLLDAMLPLVHGFEICQRIKSNKALRSVPVIMMSAVYRGWRFAQDARETYGADDFIEKPFHIADMLRRVDERLAEKPRPQAPKASTEKLYRLGVEQLAQGKATLGRRSLEQAAKEDPFSPRIQFALGGALHAVGDTYRAISAYERAVELRPKLYPALKSLASLYLEKGFRQKAAETFERASACAPDPHEREEMRTQMQRVT